MADRKAWTQIGQVRRDLLIEQSDALQQFCLEQDIDLAVREVLREPRRMQLGLKLDERKASPERIVDNWPAAGLVDTEIGCFT